MPSKKIKAEELRSMRWFGPDDVRMTSQALMAYGVGIVAYGTSQVMVRLFTASKDTRTPAWVGLASIVVNAFGCWLLMHVWGHWGIALVISLVSYVNTLVLYLIFRHRYGPLDERLLSRSLLTHATLAIVLGGSLFYLGQPLARTQGSLMTVEHVLHLAGIVTIAGGLYLVLGLLFKVEEIRALMQMIKRRVAR